MSVIPCCAALCCAVLRRAAPCWAVPCRCAAPQCDAGPWHTMPQHTMPSHAMPSHVPRHFTFAFQGASPSPNPANYCILTYRARRSPRTWKVMLMRKRQTSRYDGGAVGWWRGGFEATSAPNLKP